VVERPLHWFFRQRSDRLLHVFSAHRISHNGRASLPVSGTRPKSSCETESRFSGSRGRCPRWFVAYKFVEQLRHVAPGELLPRTASIVAPCACQGTTERVSRTTELAANLEKGPPPFLRGTGGLLRVAAPSLLLLTNSWTRRRKGVCARSAWEARRKGDGS
jgi:hypothetical protein